MLEATIDTSSQPPPPELTSELRFDGEAADKGSDDSPGFAWSLRAWSAAGVALTPEVSAARALEEVRAAWETAEPGRAERAKLARAAYLDGGEPAALPEDPADSEERRKWREALVAQARASPANPNEILGPRRTFFDEERRAAEADRRTELHDAWTATEAKLSAAREKEAELRATIKSDAKERLAEWRAEVKSVREDDWKHRTDLRVKLASEIEG